MSDQLPTPDPRMLDLATQIKALDQPRVAVMVDMFRNTIKTARAPALEVVWAQVCLLMAVIRSEPVERQAEWMDTVHRLLGLNLEMSIRKDIEDTRIH